MTDRMITGSLLHDLIRCDHRVALDAHGDTDARDEPNEFVEMLWEGGVEHELDIIAGLLAATPGAVDLRDAPSGGRQMLTMEAMEAGAPLIVGGEIAIEDLLGRPDLLRREPGGYIPGDIKLGVGEDREPGVPRLRYALQVSLYADILDRWEMLARPYGYLYLNSEADYRDPRNLTIAITPPEDMLLSNRLGGPVDAVVLRNMIAVRGIARKTRIDFTSDGRPTGKYYFQTHLNLNSARDLTVEGERLIP